MKHRRLNVKYVLVVTTIWCNLVITCNGFSYDFIGECDNCTKAILKRQGTLIDCSSRDFYRVPNCKDDNIKQLLLSSNRIEIIPENAFKSMNTLEVISLDRNKIKFIHEKAFGNLPQLRELYIEYNELNQRSFSKNVFNPLRNLQTLHMCQNPFQYDKNRTLENAVSTLNSLQSLHIPGYDGLEFGNSFEKLSQLKDLNICDRDITYNNETFRGFVNNTIEYINIKSLVLHKDTFINFKHLKGLDVSGYDTIVNVLEALWPFQNKTFEYLRLGDNSGGINWRPTFTLTPKNVKYLGMICTPELNLRNNRILDITVSATFILYQKSCIKRLDLSGNLLSGSMMSQISVFQNLEYLDICCMLQDRRKRNVADVTEKFRLLHKNWSKKPNENVSRSEKTFPKALLNDTMLTKNYTTRPIIRQYDSASSKLRSVWSFDKTEQKNTTLQQLTYDNKTLYVPQKRGNTDSHGITDNSRNKIVWMNKKSYQTVSNFGNVFIYFISPNLKVVNMSHIRGYDIPNITFFGGKGMLGIDASFSNLECNIIIQGIPNLKWFNISYWHCQYLIPSFLHYYPKLQVFVATHTHLNEGLKNIPGGSLFKGLTKLELIDLSYNNLRSLPSNFFQSQSGSLTSLILSGNFLLPIPKNLLDLINLRFLDLSYNNYTLLNETDRQVISILASRGTKINLDGNKFICTCGTGDFIKWLFSIKTLVHFERIHCVMNNGTRKLLIEIDDVKYDLDLNCSNFWLIFSISGIFILTGVLLLSIIAHRYRVELEFFFLRLKWFLLPRLPANDYQYDAIIFYYHEDTSFARNEILSYLENEVRVNVFFPSRDDLPGDHFTEVVIENIRKSRKIIFVLTKDFIKSRWIGFQMDQARMYMYKMYSENNILIILKGGISLKECPDIIKTLNSKILFLLYPNEESENERSIFYRKLKKCFEDHKKISTPKVTVIYDRNQVV